MDILVRMALSRNQNMNKMIVTKDNQKKHITIKENKTYEWVGNQKENIIEVKAGVKAKIILLEEEKTTSYIYQLGKESKLEVCHILLDSNTKITVNLEEKSEITYHVAETSTKNTKVEETIHHASSDTISNFYNHALSKHATCQFVVNGIVPKNSKGCICNQENKIICMEEGKGEIRPNLYIDNYDVVANHSAFIGKFNKDDLFYLETRGLSLENSYRLLIKGFLYGKMNLK